MSQESLADLEQKAVQQRAAVAAALKQLTVQMQPMNLAREATEGASAKASETLQVVAEKAATPKGIGVALAAFATGAAVFAGWRTRLFGLLPEKPAVEMPAPPEPPRAPEPEKPALAETSLKGTISAAAGLSAALAIGAALSKMLPMSEREQDLLQGVGDELKTQLMGFADKHVSSLIQSSSQNAPGWINLATLALGLLAARNEDKAAP